mmetsp:Transcript_10412/g.23211  ORF Transcript_10412/g.23211 Transcript_10412/m.23211 type:complete len:84 (+) Transcript_10412:57-308(+)
MILQNSFLKSYASIFLLLYSSEIRDRKGTTKKPTDSAVFDAASLLVSLGKIIPLRLTQNGGKSYVGKRNPLTNAGNDVSHFDL